MIYRAIDVWKRYADHAVRYRCFEILPTGKYCVQSADHYYSADRKKKDEEFDKQFLELLFDLGPEERTGLFDTLEEAVEQHEWEFVDSRAMIEFPEDFREQRIGVEAAIELVHRSPPRIVAYFRENPDIARQLLSESYDKRYTPSTYITEENERFEVGWYSSGYSHTRSFSNLADAATDYLLFSLGKGRWAGRDEAGANTEE